MFRLGKTGKIGKIYNTFVCLPQNVDFDFGLFLNYQEKSYIIPLRLNNVI